MSRFIALFGLLNLGTWAQGPMQLSIREAIEIGLRPGQRADTGLATEALARAESIARGNKSALYPLIEGKMSGGERSVNLGAQGFGGGGPGGLSNLNPSFTNFDGRPSVSATLLNLAQWKSWKASKLDIGRAAQELDLSMNGAALSIASQFLACLQAQAEVRAAEIDLKLSQDLLKAAEARLKAGTVTIVDVTRAKSQEASDRSALIGQRQAELEARAALFRGIGIEFKEEIQLSEIQAGNIVPQMTVEEAMAAAVERRTDLKVRESALQVAAEKVKAARLEKLPTLSGAFDLGRNGLTPANNAWTRNATVSLNVTLYDFGRRGEREAQAQIAVREERIRLLDLKREIQRQIRVAIGKIDSAKAQVEAAKAELELTSLQISQVRERAAAGLSTGLDLTDAQARFARSNRSVLKAESALQSAGVELLNATGQLRERIAAN